MILRWYNGMKAMLEYYRDTRRLDERQSAWLRSVFDAIDKGATGSIDPKSLPMLFGAANVAPPPAFVARAKVRSSQPVGVAKSVGEQVSAHLRSVGRSRRRSHRRTWAGSTSRRSRG